MVHKTNRPLVLCMFEKQILFPSQGWVSWYYDKGTELSDLQLKLRSIGSGATKPHLKVVPPRYQEILVEHVRTHRGEIPKGHLLYEQYVEQGLNGRGKRVLFSVFSLLHFSKNFR